MKRPLIVVALTALALAGITAATAFGWHAEGVTVDAQCQEGTYALSASIQGSSDLGEYVKSISPSSFPGDTHGNQSVTVVIGWAQSEETQTFYKSVYLKGDCSVPIPPPPPPCIPRNPDGSPGGKDGKPGDDDCAADETTPPALTIDTTPPVETTTPPPVTETPPETTTPPATVPPSIVSKNPPHITAPPAKRKPAKGKPKPPPVCPVGQPFKGKCSVQGSG